MLKISKLEIVVERHVKNPTSWSHDGKTEKLQPHIEQGPAMEHGNLEDFLNILRGTSSKHAWLTMIIAIVIFVYRMLMLNYLTNPRMFFFFFAKCFFLFTTLLKWTSWLILTWPADWSVPTRTPAKYGNLNCSRGLGNSPQMTLNSGWWKNHQDVWWLKAPNKNYWFSNAYCNPIFRCWCGFFHKMSDAQCVFPFDHGAMGRPLVTRQVSCDTCLFEILHREKRNLWMVDGEDIGNQLNWSFMKK